MKKNLRCKLCGNKRKKAHEKNPKKWCEARQKDWVGFPQEDVSTLRFINLEGEKSFQFIPRLMRVGEPNEEI